MASEDKQSHAQGKTLCLFVRSFVCLLKSDEILRDLSFSQRSYGRFNSSGM